MFYTPPPPPDYPETKMTEEEELNHDTLWKEHDERMIAIVREKLIALGYDPNSAETVYHNTGLSSQVKNEFKILEGDKGFNDLISIVENIQRERGF